MSATLDLSGIRSLTGWMKTPAWLVALRPADLMSAAAALNPDAAQVWTARARRAVPEPYVSAGEEPRR